ncbi:TetR/AcrR family transcriptional regulator [Stappia sp. BW2]|jgi:AcrR family transcriptional regulator|uniref:TetR/AcrR family transcriptional regulator n=1 Tax=Stappia sp. BW2 TaxID=2592622 RepID=UPI0011DE73B9|nr:TetR/AcrR family transcriptional regulator [Stappia sp. BW2]TYC72502.1 TetR/AcrR family transcriptional regulator [Stappia sp. BW2]
MSRPAKVTVEEWVEIGLDALRHQGFEALKADSLSKARGVTRGSFYNYFKAVTDYHAAVILRWKQLAAQNVIVEIDKLPSKRAALHELLRLAFGSSERLERQMRIWAENDPLPRRAVAEVDEMRIAYLKQLLLDNGVPSRSAGTRANLIYDCYLGCSMRRSLTEEELEELVQELMRLCS